MRVLLSGGGTAGHINPALAIAKKIKSAFPDAAIAFVGTKNGMENRLVAKEGFAMYHVEVRGFLRKLTLKNIPIAYQALTAPGKAKKIIRQFRPDIVVGTGGYVSWPIVKAASGMGIPTAIHEQNAALGMTTRVLSKFADSVMISFQETKEHIKNKEKVVLVGNPVNPAMRDAKPRKNEMPYLLSYGGSLGAMRINDVMLDFIRENPLRGKIRHTHAIGSVEWKQRGETIREYALDRAENTEILEYIYDMPAKMAAADLVVCRAGAITLAELAVLGKPAILIPSPNVTNQHQLRNASVVAAAGGAVVIEEKDLSSGRIRDEIVRLLVNPRLREEMGRAMKKLAIYDSDEKILEIIRRLTNKRE